MTTLHDPLTASANWVEHRVLEHIKQALRVTLDWNAPVVSMPRKHSSLQFTLKSFRRHLDRVMTIEEEDGYFDDVVEARPSLQSRVECLVRDHNRFRARIRQITQQLDGLRDGEEIEFGEVCMEIRRLLNEVDRHDAQEIELLQESLLVDDGGEG
jgi:hemerythrin-like domain-containing protein